MRPPEGTEGLTSFGPDRAVAVWFRDHVQTSGPLVDAGHVVAVAFHPWTFRVLVLLGCLLVWRAGRGRAALVVGATMALGSLLGVALKVLFARPRPVWGEPVATEVGYSMPSGHALNAALGVGLLLVLAWPWLRARGATVPAVAAGAVVVAVTALDRLVLGVHYLSDVTVGVVLGAGLALLAGRLASRSARSAAVARGR